MVHQWAVSLSSSQHSLSSSPVSHESRHAHIRYCPNYSSFFFFYIFSKGTHVFKTRRLRRTIGAVVAVTVAVLLSASKKERNIFVCHHLRSPHNDFQAAIPAPVHTCLCVPLRIPSISLTITGTLYSSPRPRPSGRECLDSPRQL